MRSMYVRMLMASLMLIGVLFPSKMAGQEPQEPGEVRRAPDLRLCPMPVVGMSPGAVERHVDDLRLKLQEDDTDPTASGPCFNPLVMQLTPPDVRLSRKLLRFREPAPHRDPFGLRDSLPLVLPRPSVSLPFYLLPPAQDP